MCVKAKDSGASTASLQAQHDTTYTNSRIKNDGQENTFDADAVSLKESTEQDSAVLNKADGVAEQDANDGDVALLLLADLATICTLGSSGSSSRS